MVSMRASDRSDTPTSSTTFSCGMAKRCPEASTIRAETIARVRGILIRKVVPRPATDDSSMVPPMRSILVRTTSMPTPRPETLVTFSAVEKPARKMNCRICCSLMPAMATSVARPLAMAFWRMRSRSRPRPSSAMRMKMWPLS